MPTCRSLLQLSLAGVAGAVGIGLYTWRVEPHWLEVVRRPLPIRGLPPGLAGRTLVHLSDIHVGHRVDDAYVLRAFDRVSRLNPDIVVYTGDFISFHAQIFDQAAAVYDKAPHGRLETIGIFGNHDYGPNWSHPEIADHLHAVLARRGISILRNERHEVAGVQVVGLDDLWAGRFAPEAVLPRLNPDQPTLVLSHNPDTVDRPGWGNHHGWVLSGHTHGGQCKPPFLPPPLLPVENRRYTAGEFGLSGDRRLYISRGIGHLRRVRFNVRPEVTVFELREASNRA